MELNNRLKRIEDKLPKEDTPNPAEYADLKCLPQDIVIEAVKILIKVGGIQSLSENPLSPADVAYLQSLDDDGLARVIFDDKRARSSDITTEQLKQITEVS